MRLLIQTDITKNHVESGFENTRKFQNLKALMLFSVLSLTKMPDI